MVDARRENNSHKNASDFLRSIVGHRHTNFQHSNESVGASLSTDFSFYAIASVCACSRPCPFTFPNYRVIDYAGL